MKGKRQDAQRTFPSRARNDGKELKMLGYAAMLLCFGFIAVGLHWTGIATVATQSSWTLLASGMVLLMIHVVAGRTGRVS
jgi:uncharacterized membrane protein YtjA (UPF0391 family)